MIYRFLRMYSDIITQWVPSYWQVEAETREEAIEKFCAAYRLTQLEVNGEHVWFETGGRSMMRYLVDEGRNE